MLKRLSIFFLSSLFALFSIKAMALSIDAGLGVGFVPDIFSGSQSIWITKTNLEQLTDSNGDTAIYQETVHLPFFIANEDSYGEAEVNSDISYDGSNGIYGFNVGLVAKARANALFFRLGIDYAFVAGGGSVKYSMKNSSADFTTESSVSGYILSIPLSIGVNMSGKINGKEVIGYVGIGPSILISKMTRETEFSGTTIDNLKAGLGISSFDTSVDYSTTVVGFHWVVGAQTEVAEKIYIGFEVMGTRGGKVITETKSIPDSQVNVLNNYQTLGTAGMYAYQFLLTSYGYSSNTFNTNTTTKTTALTQTMNLSDIRTLITVTYKIM